MTTGVHVARDGEAGMVDQTDMTGTAAAAAFRDDDGGIRAEFLDNVREAIERGDATALQALVGELNRLYRSQPALWRRPARSTC